MRDRSISVIIPAFNAAAFLGRAIQSVVDQNYSDYEIIVVDDGSTDDTLVVANRLAEQIQQLRVLHQENGGVSSARNVGLDAATGDYVLFLDADDVLQSGLFMDALGKPSDASSEPECVLFGFDYIYADRTEENIPSLSAGVHTREEVLQAFWHLYREGVLSNIGTKIYCRENLTQHQIRFNEQATILEDVSFFLAALQYVDQVTVLDKSYYGYYMDANAASIQKRYRPQYGEHLNRFFQNAMALSVPLNKDLYLVYMDAMLLVLRNDLLDTKASHKEVIDRYRAYMDYPLVIASHEQIARSDVRPMKYLFYQMLWKRHPGLLYELTVLWSKAS